jgi:glycosyltransferase involved in cell wall biosynthesis
VAPVHFCLVGDGTLRSWIEAELRRRGLVGRFHLTGLLPPERMPAVFHASDIVVHCSLREGLARTIPQAMLAARPVISFEIGGAGEVVDSQTGILLAPGDAAGLRAAIEKLAGSPALRESLGAAGRERCRIMFDHNRMVDEIEKVYHHLAGR